VRESGSAVTIGPRQPPDAAANVPQLGGAQVAEDGALAAGKYRRHPSPFLAEHRVADGVNTAMNTVKTTGG
jgi:hypothetical protein